MTRSLLGAVAIGRNEGDRLKACLRSLVSVCERVVYVDSGSTDDSVAFARSLGVTVVELDTGRPFTAARARNAGFRALTETDPAPAFVQFVDGDCAVVAGWLEAGLAAMQADPTLGLVTGWRSEINPEASVYNAMCEVDWHRPAGPIETSGGDMLVRAEAFRAVGGFNPDLIAGEDPEFSLRLGKAGWRLERLPLPMTLHDAAMTSFGQWWKRTVRTGHCFAEIGRMHPPHFRGEIRRVWIYGLALPLIFVLGLFTSPLIALAVVALYLLSFVKTLGGLRGQPMAAKQAGLLTLAKIPNLIGMLAYHRSRARGEAVRIIEYK